MSLLRLALLLLFNLAVTATLAQDLPLTGPVILTVTGLDPATFPGGRAEFDLPRLQALGESQITTSSIWTKGTHVYTGVMLRSLLSLLNASGARLNLHALNDYAIAMPLDETSEQGPMLAFLLDGTAMSVRDKGPIWVIYPFDSDAKFRTDQIFARAVWQLDRIEVLQ